MIFNQGTPQQRGFLFAGRWVDLIMNKVLARGGIELIAVILGITISLWIDDRKNERLELEEQISLLENLQRSLEQDLDYAEKIQKQLDSCLVSQNFLISLNCSSVDTLNNELFSQHVRHSTKGSWSFFPRYGVYRALSQNNDLGLIENDDLKSRLITLYDFVYKRYENMDIVMENHYQYTYPKYLIDDYFAGIENDEFSVGKEFFIDYSINKEKICSGSLKKEILHINSITVYAYQSVKRITVQVSELIEQINSELNRLDN